MRTLEETLKYRNERVLNKFRTLFELSRTEAEEIAVEAYRWLWLNAHSKEDRKNGRSDVPAILVIHEGMVIIDEFWHTFVLHTKDYADFCNEYFGEFIHHSPATPDFVPPSLAETEKQLEYICDIVGEETLTKWYEEYPLKYSADALVRLQRPRIYGKPCEAFTS